MQTYNGNRTKNNGGVPNYYIPNGYQQQPSTFLTQPRKNYWGSNDNSIIPTYHKPDNSIRQRYGSEIPFIPGAPSNLNNYRAQSYTATQNITYRSVAEIGEKDSFYGLQQVYTSHVSGPTVLLLDPSKKKRWSGYSYFFLITFIVICLLIAATVVRSRYNESPIVPSVPQFDQVKKVKIVMSMDDDSEASLETFDQ